MLTHECIEPIRPVEKPGEWSPRIRAGALESRDRIGTPVHTALLMRPHPIGLLMHISVVSCSVEPMPSIRAKSYVCGRSTRPLISSAHSARFTEGRVELP